MEHHCSGHFCAALTSGGVMIYGKYQISKIPGLTLTGALEYATKDNPDAVIAVGMINLSVELTKQQEVHHNEQRADDSR